MYYVGTYLTRLFLRLLCFLFQVDKSLVPGVLELPTEEEATVSNLNDYLQVVAGSPELMATHLIQVTHQHLVIATSECLNRSYQQC